MWLVFPFFTTLTLFVFFLFFSFFTPPGVVATGCATLMWQFCFIRFAKEVSRAGTKEEIGRGKEKTLLLDREAVPGKEAFHEGPRFGLIRKRFDPLGSRPPFQTARDRCPSLHG